MKGTLKISRENILLGFPGEIPGGIPRRIPDRISEEIHEGILRLEILGKIPGMNT